MADGSRIRRRILHTADLHLGLFGGGACQVLEALVNVAIKTKADLVIIAGDFFEYNGVNDNVVSFAVEQLQRLSVPTFILPGNHDCLVPDSVYQRANLWNGATNIRIFRALQGETLALPSLGISVWGKPIASYGSDAHPLAGIPQHREKGQWHIAVAHGHYTDTLSGFERSFPITHEEIVASHQDYIALGHSARFRCVCSGPVKAYYCDSPSLFGTVAIVDLDETDETRVQVAPYYLFSYTRKDMREALDDVSKHDILKAIAQFDREFPKTNDYDRWLDKRSYKYALEYEGRCYPPKKIMSMATAMPRSCFYGGWHSYGVNEYFERKDFKIILKSECIAGPSAG